MKVKNWINDTKISELHQIAPLQYWNIKKVKYQTQIKEKRLKLNFFSIKPSYHSPVRIKESYLTIDNQMINQETQGEREMDVRLVIQGYIYADMVLQEDGNGKEKIATFLNA